VSLLFVRVFVHLKDAMGELREVWSKMYFMLTAIGAPISIILGRYIKGEIAI
jgi:hypothetical protein